MACHVQLCGCIVELHSFYFCNLNQVDPSCFSYKPNVKLVILLVVINVSFSVAWKNSSMTSLTFFARVIVIGPSLTINRSFSLLVLVPWISSLVVITYWVSWIIWWHTLLHRVDRRNLCNASSVLENYCGKDSKFVYYAMQFGCTLLPLYIWRILLLSIFFPFHTLFQDSC